MTEPERSLPEQIWELADAQCSGIITESEMETLERLLLEHPEYRQDYLDYVFLHIGLAGAVTSGELLSSAAIEKSVSQLQADLDTSSNSARRSLAQTLCLVVCLLSVGLFLFFKERDEPEHAAPRIAEEPSQYYFDENATPPDEVATLSEAAQATWELVGKSPALTHHFQPGTVKVTSGNVEVAFSGGADISVASPALFGMERKNQGTLFSGSLSARRTDREAPFTLETPSVEVVDRGTEYEVSVNEAAETFVHVLDGQLEVKPRGRLPRFFWTFDQPEAEPLRDAIGNRSIQAGKNAKRVHGL
ncbi:MAG: FecR domain-containing protein, partial [Planctomycetaceae bacterium]|nr:FecR domain-containing protein [Planctomycetaceae bacterium]